MKVTCSCKRIKKEFQCELIRNKKTKIIVECDEICEQKKEEERRKNEILEEERRKIEELKNKKELEKYEKLFVQQKKKNRKRTRSEADDVGFLQQYKYVVAGVTFLITSLVVIYLFN